MGMSSILEERRECPAHVGETRELSRSRVRYRRPRPQQVPYPIRFPWRSVPSPFDVTYTIDTQSYCTPQTTPLALSCFRPLLQYSIAPIHGACSLSVTSSDVFLRLLLLSEAKGSESRRVLHFLLFLAQMNTPSIPADFSLVSRFRSLWRHAVDIPGSCSGRRDNHSRWSLRHWFQLEWRRRHRRAPDHKHQSGARMPNSFQQRMKVRPKPAVQMERKGDANDRAAIPPSCCFRANVFLSIRTS